MAEKNTKNDDGLGTCANCDESAVVKVDDGTANPVQFCERHTPDNV